ncbi:MAG: hypothetical protein AAGE59_38055 [Cyanobacteria bacterium P01_F01_bin.86]
MDSEKGKDKVLPLRIQYTDWIDIVAAANADGIQTISTWIKQQAILAARKRKKEVIKKTA